MTTPLPLITCICITNKRIALLRKAINCYCLQDYKNKELLISYPKKDKLTKYIVEKIRQETGQKLLALERPDELSLGEARNSAISHSNGEYFCTWDDDDWYHPNRLSYQYQSINDPLQVYQACVLNQLILYDQRIGKAYLSFLYPWENTLLCRKDIFNTYQYHHRDIGEDSNIIDVLDANKSLYHLRNVPYLYIYIYHSGNTWGYHHFKTFIKRSQLLDASVTHAIQQQIN